MGEVQVDATRGIDLSLFPGELVVLPGPFGSGKSTLLNIIGGLDVPTSGRVIYREGPSHCRRHVGNTGRLCLRARLGR